MRYFIKTSNCFWGLLLILSSLVQGQTLIEGSITYVTRDQAFMDLGKKAGLQVGDTVQVIREGQEPGSALVVQASGSSSAIESIGSEPMSFQIGDRVLATIRAVVDSPDPSSVQDSVSLPVPARVFLDSSAYTPRTQRSLAETRKRFAPTTSGYLSARFSDRGGEPGASRETRTSLSGQFRILDLGIRHLDLSTYIRSNHSSRDSLLDNRLYNLMLSYAHPESRYSFLLGRIYHPQFSMLGTVDGVGVTRTTVNRRLALAVGETADLTGSSDHGARLKMGLVDEELTAWGNVQAGLIAELESGDIARNYLFLGSSARLGAQLRVRSYGEFDLDLTDQSKYQETVSFTRFRATVTWKPWNPIILSSRYSYRENVVDLLDTARTEWDRAARHAFNSSLTLITRSGVTLTLQGSVRGDDQDRLVKMFGSTINHRNLFSRNASMSLGGMAMFSYLSEGGRMYLSLEREILPWLDVDVYDELFFYRLLGEQDFRFRHLPELSLAVKVPGLQRLRIRTRLEQEEGETLYRFSLSASRQF